MPDQPNINHNLGDNKDSILVPKNVFIYLKNRNITSDFKCAVEQIARNMPEHSIYIYLNHKNNETSASQLDALKSVYDKIVLKEDSFNYQDFLETNFSSRAKFSNGFLTKLNKKLHNQTIDRSIKSLFDLWLHGGYYFSVNVSYEQIKSSNELNQYELFSFYCNAAHDKHKNCKINFLKLEKYDCILELAIKNYLLYYEQHKLFNFNHIFMNLYSKQKIILNKMNKISQNSYLKCFKSKINHHDKHQSNSFEYLFRFSKYPTSDLVNFNENTCPITYSNGKSDI